MPPEQVFGHKAGLDGLFAARLWWDAEVGGPYPNPLPYFRGPVAEIIKNALNCKKEAVA